MLDLARRFRGTVHAIRFIEFMDVGATNGWRLDDVVPAADIVRTIDAESPLEPVEPAYRGEVAQRCRYRDGPGEIGVIASVTQPFCGDCTRARISADGKLFTCLFSVRGPDLRELLRSAESDDVVDEPSASVWERRKDRYSELRTEQTSALRKIDVLHRRLALAGVRLQPDPGLRLPAIGGRLWPRTPRPGSSAIPLARTMSATAPTTAAPAINRLQRDLLAEKDPGKDHRDDRVHVRVRRDERGRGLGGARRTR